MLWGEGKTVPTPSETRGILKIGCVGYFLAVPSKPYFSVLSTLVLWVAWGWWGNSPCSWGYWLLGQFPVGVPGRQGPEAGGGFN